MHEHKHDVQHRHEADQSDTKKLVMLVMFSVLNVLQRDDVCTRVNCAQARLQPEQCECRTAED